MIQHMSAAKLVGCALVVLGCVGSCWMSVPQRGKTSDDARFKQPPLRESQTSHMDRNALDPNLVAIDVHQQLRANGAQVVADAVSIPIRMSSSASERPRYLCGRDAVDELARVGQFVQGAFTSSHRGRCRGHIDGQYVRVSCDQLTGTGHLNITLSVDSSSGRIVEVSSITHVRRGNVHQRWTHIDVVCWATP